MRVPETRGFNPNWRDDVFNRHALELHLALPSMTSQNGRVWIETRLVHQETIFGRQYTYNPCRLETAVVKSSDLSQRFTAVDQEGQEISSDSPIMAAIFPPKAWMSDSGEERCMMFAAAKQAKGHILVGGLGLGIYPQFVLKLSNTVKSITIVESDPHIISLIDRGWFQCKPEHKKIVTIVKGTIEEYLSNTQRMFDTIYLDTWEDADPRFLSNVNHLIALALPHCSSSGTIQCWGYAIMVNSFIETVKTLTQQRFPWRKYRLDPALQAYANWLENQESGLSEAEILQKARFYALNTQHPFDVCERHQYFTRFSTSLTDY